MALVLQDSKNARAMADALAGCSFYADNPDVLLKIEAVDLDSQLLTLTGPNGPLSLIVQRLGSGYVLETGEASRIEPIIARSKPDHIVAAERARIRLAGAGIRGELLSNDDATGLAHALGADPRNCPSDFNARALIADVLIQNDLHQAYITLAAHWDDGLAQQGLPLPVDVLIQLATAHRAAGNLDTAMRCTDIAVMPGAKETIPARQLSILFTQRAALHLDQYLTDKDPVRLASARKCAARSFAIDQSEECSAVYRRLEKLEKAMNEGSTGSHRPLEGSKGRY